MIFTFTAYRDWMNPVPPPSIYVDDKFYEITIDPATSLDSAGKISLFICLCLKWKIINLHIVIIYFRTLSLQGSR